MKLYAITNWAETYESAESKRYKRLPWMKLSADSEDDLLDLQDAFGDEAPAAFGCWTSIRLVATQSSTRGLLGDTHGKAYSPQRIATKAKMPLALTERVLGWGEQSQRLEVKEVQVTHGSDPGATQQTDGLRNVTERKVRVSDASHPRPLAEPNETVKPKAPAKAKPTTLPDGLSEQIVQAWNEVRDSQGLDRWPQARAPRDKARGNIAARLKECDSPEDFVREYLDRLARMSRSPHYQGANGWSPSMPWVFEPNGWEKSGNLTPADVADTPENHDLDKHLENGGSPDEWRNGQYRDRPMGLTAIRNIVPDKCGELSSG